MSEGKWEIVRHTITKEEDLNTKLEYKNKVLKSICENNLVPPDDMSFLHDIINTPNEHGYTPLLLATQNSRSEVIIKCVENGADVTTVVHQGKNRNLVCALFLALSHQHHETIELTLEAYASLIHPNILHLTDLYGNTPLHRAVQTGKSKVMEMLIKAGTDMKMRNKDGDTPLLLALDDSSALNPEDFSQLINPSTVHLTNKCGDSPIHKAVQYGLTEVIEILMKAGADLTIRNKDGETPLLSGLSHSYCLHETKAIAKVIHSSTVNITRNTDGQGPLHLAAGYGLAEVMDMLIKACADLTLKDKNGKIPLQLGLECPYGFCYPEDLCKLIPMNVSIDSHEIVAYACALIKHRCHPFNTEATIGMLSTLLLSVRRKDFFEKCDLQVSSCGDKLEFELRHSQYNISAYMYVAELYVISCLVRRGLGGSTGPKCCVALSEYKGKDGHFVFS